MPITLKDKMKELSPAERMTVEARAAELIAEENTLCELLRALKSGARASQTFWLPSTDGG